MKVGSELRELDAAAPREDLMRFLIHEDGFLRIPVLVVGDTLVRGWHEDAYRAALGVRRAR